MATYKDVLMLVDKVSEPLKKIEQQTKKVTGGMDQMKSQLKNIGGKFMAFAKKALLAFTIVTTALTVALKKTTDYGDRIDKMSQKIGMSTKSFQEWDYIMSQNGGNVESLQMGFRTLTTQVANASKGNKESAGIFKRLGVNIKDTNGKLRTQDEIFNDSVRSLQKMGAGVERDAMAQKLFGRSALEMKVILNQQADAIDELREKANKLGLIIDEKDIKNAVILKDTFDTFSRAFQARFATVMMKVMPIFTKLLEKITPYIKIVTDYITKLGRNIASSPAFAMMIEEFKKLGAEFQTLYNENKEFFDALKIAFEVTVTTLIPNLITSLTFVARMIIKVVNAVLNFGAQCGAVIGNIIGWFLSIPTKIQTAFINVQNIILKVLIAIKKIINTIPALKGLAGVFGNMASNLSKNTVNQTQNNNTTNNSTVNNNYYGGNQKQTISGMLQPAYAMP